MNDIVRLKSGMVVDMRPWRIGERMRMLGPEGTWIPLKEDNDITFVAIMSGYCVSDEEAAKIDAKSGYDPNKKGLGWYLKRARFLTLAKLGGIRSFIDKKLYKNGHPPYKVDVCDRFHSMDEDGYDTIGTYKSLEEALSVARQITQDSMKDAPSLGGWLTGGEEGLVYDSKDTLIWSGRESYIGDELLDSLCKNMFKKKD